ncbi:hypothetical protein QE152_g27748 [Popillia japonica]|uniref:Uncharacterized protein n=1 Tax=Popillia japonica TaxID=7064 RepID=A0AAW1JKF4_POPJA
MAEAERNSTLLENEKDSTISRDERTECRRKKTRETRRKGKGIVDNATEKAMVHKGFVPMDLLLVMNFNRIYCL